MHYLTTAEQERLAYAEGYTETAAVLARLDDAHRALGEETHEQYESDRLRADLIESAHHVGQLREELDSLFEDYKNARNLVDEERERSMQLETAVRVALDLLGDPSKVPAVTAYLREVLA